MKLVITLALIFGATISLTARATQAPPAPCVRNMAMSLTDVVKAGSTSTVKETTSAKGSKNTR